MSYGNRRKAKNPSNFTSKRQIMIYLATAAAAVCLPFYTPLR